MTSYLFDTSVLSATAPGKPPLPPDAAAWLLQQTGNLFVPAFALHELRRGIAKLDRSGATAQAQTLMAWLQGTVTDYSAEILPIPKGSAAASQIRLGYRRPTLRGGTRPSGPGKLKSSAAAGNGSSHACHVW
ncbi:PIN domain-containing protein [Mesorhizobium sp.]|uniref:PIN domain-containing protein n=1 Tax=Mesorhizobium sp. TaxID=1871066 RepID=UPI0034502646